MPWGIFIDNDGRPQEPTYFAGLRRDDLTLVWRSLSTSSRETAQRWLASARCHGIDAHTETCADCRTTPEERTMHRNIYWREALASGNPIVIKKGNAGRYYKCGEDVVFWHGQEWKEAQKALDKAATKGAAEEPESLGCVTAPNDPCPKCGITPFPACGCVGGFF